MRLLAALLALSLATGCSTPQMRVACVGAGVADAGTTAVGISKGAQEANPILAPAPAAISLGLTAVTIIAGDALRRAGHEKAARWLYGGCAVLHGGAAGWNMTVIR